MAHIIAVGNEKGGAGKSTVSMHVASALARMGHRVGALDLDLRQKTLGRYIENRTQFSAQNNIALPSPNLSPCRTLIPTASNPGKMSMITAYRPPWPNWSRQVILY